MRLDLFRFLLLFFAFLGALSSVQATHLRAGEITVTRDNCSSLTFTITVTVYTDTESGVLFGGTKEMNVDILDFGDGTRVVIPETTSTPRPDLGLNMGIASWTTQHTFGGPGRYIISYREPNRNENVVNVLNSVNTTFYIETLINIDPFLGCNNTPKLLIAPVDKGCTGVAFQHNPGAFDPDGDRLRYELVTPFKDRNTAVDGYNPPNSPAYYLGNYNNSNEAQNGPPTFAINPLTGTITWDAPGKRGEYNIAFHVIEERLINGSWVRLGYVRRDMQIIIDECDNERPDLIIPPDTCIVAGTRLDVIIKGLDFPNTFGDTDDVKIQAFSEIFGTTFISPASVSPDPAIFQPTTAANPAEFSLSWNTVCEHIRQQPYQIVFKITDNGQPNLVTFKTWFVTVVAPAPELTDATIQARNALITWNEYECDNAESIQVWRRVDSFDFTPANCETGMPSSLGYTLIATVPVSTVSYLDKNLNVGAAYCYRLVALYPLPSGGQSYVSMEKCIPPIEADAPVITHVSVEKTDASNGEIRVSWRKPFDINKVQFPPPYYYKVWRAQGFTGATPWTSVHAGTLEDDTTQVDTGINTLDDIYSYRIVLYADAAANNPIDTSAVASMVRLEIESGDKRLDLTWSSFTPWSTNSFAFPLHDVFRGPEGSTETSGLVLFEQVDVTLAGQLYSDPDENGIPLDDDKEYCYRILTRGTYGNPNIDEPLLNYSQVVCAQPSDTEPPTCVPDPVVANVQSCDEILSSSASCSISFFANTVKWNRASPTACDGDVFGYKVYVANTTTGVFTPVIFDQGKTFTKDTFFIDNNNGLGLTSYARCYKISVVDRSGNESALSPAVCNDNCPFYALPNVFTPNGDGCNDLFRAYGDPFEDGGDPSCAPAGDDSNLCARFVEKVVFKVYNRWGNLIYEFNSVEGDTNEKSIYIRWNGRDLGNTLVPTGVYFYSADVTFTTIDPKKRNQTLKGWVHVVW